MSNSADQLQQLGQAFFRLDADRQRSTGGVGLGLCLCRLVAKVHGGELVLKNAEPGLRDALIEFQKQTDLPFLLLFQELITPDFIGLEADLKGANAQKLA